MTDHERAFLTAIAAEPDADVHRLIYADWLEEHVQGGRAEFIRASCEWWRLGRQCQSPVEHGTLAGYPVFSNCGKCRTCTLGKRMDALWSPEDWAPLPELKDGRWCPIWQRGFISSIALPCDAFLRYAADIIEAVPMLEEVRLSDVYIYPVDGEPNGRVYIRHLPKGATGYSTPLEIYDLVESQDVQPVKSRPAWKRFPIRMIAEKAISNAALSFARDQSAQRKEPRPGVIALNAL